MIVFLNNINQGNNSIYKLIFLNSDKPSLTNLRNELRYFKNSSGSEYLTTNRAVPNRPDIYLKHIVSMSHRLLF